MPIINFEYECFFAQIIIKNEWKLMFLHLIFHEESINSKNSYLIANNYLYLRSSQIKLYWHHSFFSEFGNFGGGGGGDLGQLCFSGPLRFNCNTVVCISAKTSRLEEVCGFTYMYIFTYIYILSGKQNHQMENRKLVGW